MGKQTGFWAGRSRMLQHMDALQFFWHMKNVWSAGGSDSEHTVSVSKEIHCRIVNRKGVCVEPWRRLTCTMVCNRTRHYDYLWYSLSYPPPVATRFLCFATDSSKVYCSVVHEGLRYEWQRANRLKCIQ